MSRLVVLKQVQSAVRDCDPEAAELERDERKRTEEAETPLPPLRRGRESKYEGRGTESKQLG